MAHELITTHWLQYVWQVICINRESDARRQTFVDTDDRHQRRCEYPAEYANIMKAETEAMVSLAEDRGPNICSCSRLRSECWTRHSITAEDTMTRLALKYDTSIGRICRANRMHSQDVLQARRHVWVPVPSSRFQMGSPQKSESDENPETPTRKVTPNLPSHFYRQSDPNPNPFADDDDPLLFITVMKEVLQ
ncbi:uncharacterized protein LOC6612465 [Drosophila sechellia]|uniref:GM12664 n=1 Tax=Drosophila sechellia TaxID=7238 RepID=B4I0V1_DROSE|nr:uncharacterized protein LOC6612465 [Drosophila sechellia]EDW53132.1 GM12664 [Drosophila sechellia]